MIQYIIIILNLFLLETMLSIDNVAVLAIMVKDLPAKQQTKALRWGIAGAFLFRFICLFIASWLIHFQYLKILGGIYLLFLVAKQYVKEEQEEIHPGRRIVSLLHAIIMVEFLDLAFSIDNILACSALTSNFYLIMIGVGMGIIGIRFMAGYFVKLIYKFPKLEEAAYIVIAILGIRLIVEGILKVRNNNLIIPEYINFGFSILCIIIFLVPLLTTATKEEL